MWAVENWKSKTRIPTFPPPRLACGARKKAVYTKRLTRPGEPVVFFLLRVFLRGLRVSALNPKARLKVKSRSTLPYDHTPRASAGARTDTCRTCPCPRWGDGDHAPAAGFDR